MKKIIQKQTNIFAYALKATVKLPYNETIVK